MSQKLNLAIGKKAEAKEVKYFEVTGVNFKFTQEMLNDPQPITLTYRQLFDLVTEKQNDVQEMN